MSEITNKANVSFMSVVAVAFNEYKVAHGSEQFTERGLDAIADDVRVRILSITNGAVNVTPVFGLIGNNQLSVVDWVLNDVALSDIHLQFTS